MPVRSLARPRARSRASHDVRSRARHAAPAAVALIAITPLAVAVTGCGSSPSAPGAPGRNAGTAPATARPPVNRMGRTPTDMSGMGPMAGGNGLSPAADGYRMTSRLTALPARVPAAYTFTIIAPDGAPLTSYATDQTKRIHFYAIRSDLTGFQHVHPVMAHRGTWTAPLSGLKPGRWRFYATFTPATGPAAGTEFILSRTITVPGTHAATPLPVPEAVTTYDGYTIATAGELIPGVAMPLTFTITRHGHPVTTLQPYLGTYAHLTAIHAGDLAFAHLHPEGTTDGSHGGPTLTFNAKFSQAGLWRLFLQFRTSGRLHTIPITVNP